MTMERCHYFVKRKNRYCRMTVKNGNKFCGEHSSNNMCGQELLTENERIQCPLDPTHTCYKRKLSSHIKKCNARKTNAPKPYIQEHCNIDTSNHNILIIPLSQIDEVKINNVIAKINEAYESLPAIPEEVLTHTILQDELINPEYGSTTKKHLWQNASLLQHLHQANLVKENTCFIDFGAGKGNLTYWLAQMIRDHKGSSILLIDRSSLRHKKDNKLKSDEYAVKVERIRADIADLKLCGLQEFADNNNRKVAVAKHLCGTATDLALQCLANAMRSDSQLKVQGLVFAFCCHHRCEYSSYVGKDFLARSGFSVDEFPILCKIASWATCGFEKQMKDSRNNDTWKEKECIGRKVKNLLNWGRVEFLQKLEFNCRLVQYVSLDVSLENTCIIATKNADST